MEFEPHYNIMLEFLKAFSNAERLEIAGALANHSHTLDELATKLSIHPKEVLHHVDLLLKLGLVTLQDNIYWLDASALEALSRQILANQRPVSKPEDFEGDAYVRKILSDYMNTDGTLKALPTQNKKLMVILRYAMKFFEPGKRYPEKQVNEILVRFHEDTASLRRYMVDHGLFKREKGIYWLSEETANDQ